MRNSDRRNAMKFFLLVGTVSLFADMTYEGARSITGPFLYLLGASAGTVGLVSGLGEFTGHALRPAAGYAADQTRRYWLLTFLGYAVNLISVPLLALAGRWEVAAALVVLERTRTNRQRHTGLFRARHGCGRRQCPLYGKAVRRDRFRVPARGSPADPAAALPRVSQQQCTGHRRRDRMGGRHGHARDRHARRHRGHNPRWCPGHGVRAVQHDLRALLVARQYADGRAIRKVRGPGRRIRIPDRGGLRSRAAPLREIRPAYPRPEQ